MAPVASKHEAAQKQAERNQPPQQPAIARAVRPVFVGEPRCGFGQNDQQYDALIVTGRSCQSLWEYGFTRLFVGQPASLGPHDAPDIGREDADVVAHLPDTRGVLGRYSDRPFDLR